MSSFLDISHLYVSFQGVPVVEDVSFAVERGESFALVGESGSGKSTIARVIAGLQRPDSGTVHFEGERKQLVFQDSLGSLNPRMTVEQTLSEVIAFHRSGCTLTELLDLVELPYGIARQYPHELSGGQRQRINIARALAVRPDLLVADEPVSALDVSVQAQIIHLLDRLRRDLGVTLIFIAHDLAVVSVLCPRAAILHRGRIIEEGVTADIFVHPKTDYVRALLAAVPKVGAFLDT